MTKMFRGDSLFVYLRQSIPRTGHTPDNIDYTVNFRHASSTTQMGSFWRNPMVQATLALLSQEDWQAIESVVEQAAGLSARRSLARLDT